MRPGPELFYPRKRRNPTMSDEKRCTCEEDASNLGSPPCAKCFIGEPTGEPVGMHFYTVEHWPEMATLMLTDRPEPSYPSHRGGPGRKLARVTPVTLVEGHTHPPKPVAEAGECLIEARAALEMQPCLCKDGFRCTRCKGLDAFDKAGVKVPERDSDGDGLIPQPADLSANTLAPVPTESREAMELLARAVKYSETMWSGVGRPQWEIEARAILGEEEE